MDLGTVAEQAASSTAAPPSDVGSRSIAYQPALDGLRALAVVMVLLFHAGFSWMPGGYVGVSVFFTLSGYLITSLALVEHDETGRLGVGAFYARRIRRLMPASLICVAGVMVAAWLDQFDGVTRLRRDLWAALLQVFNWVTLAAGEGYAEQMSRAVGQRAPLDHYWSLAIEEQFYWVWPLALVVILRLSPMARTVAVSALAAAGVVATVAITHVWGADATYFATPARLPEILIGAVVAVLLHQRRDLRWLDALKSRAVWLAAAGLVAVGLAATMWPASGGPAYHGWLPLFAVASAAVIVGLQAASPIRRLLSLAPLVILGRISYGVYLYHWPIYTLVDERRADIGRAPLFALRAGITVAVAGVSYVLVEQPIRTRRLSWRPTVGVAAVACSVVAAVVAFVPDRGGTYTFVAAEARAAAMIPPVGGDEQLEPMALESGSRMQAGIPLGGLSRPARVMIVGDSTADSTGEGMIQWAAEHSDVMFVTASAAVGCGLNATGLLPDDGYREVCERVRDGIVPRVERLQPDVVVAMVTFRDMEDRLWHPAEGVLSPTDGRFRQRLLDGYEVITKRILEAGAGVVIWVIPPTPSLPAVGSIAPLLEPDRIAAYRRVIRALPLSFPGQVVIADMATWLDGQEQPPERFDGLHWTLDGSVRVTTEFLAPAIFAVLLPEQPS